MPHFIEMLIRSVQDSAHFLSFEFNLHSLRRFPHFEICKRLILIKSDANALSPITLQFYNLPQFLGGI